MTRTSASTYPNHKYDFRDVVFIPALNTKGWIQSISDQDDGWYYQIGGLPYNTGSWWHENQIELI